MKPNALSNCVAIGIPTKAEGTDMPKLTDFEPRWIDIGDRRGLGFLFRCTTGHCQELNIVLFANPIDGGPPLEGNTFPVHDQLRKAGIIKDGERLYRGCGLFRWQRAPQ